ncbi:MAG TPA: 2-amino-thiazoline-4-carboxylic acid hydrolase [Dehalococcoidia bacterium]|nr:2-amino-thiazoline-4-carboxylic acid hydrolase [Dehalococcoidia bacterium]|tara:strand:- start:616 stop:1119 length:504 start_codon:yes stop_codon:yes gene_type:complete
MVFDPNQMDLIDRRHVEALVLGPLLREFQKEIGVERTNEIARNAISKIAREQGARFAKDIGSNNLEDYVANKDAWRRQGALEVEILESSADRYSFDVSRCKYAEMYRSLGYGDLGEIFSCTRDFEFCSGFNPEVQLVRTQTIMQGASHCDFRYSMDKSDQLVESDPE